MILGFKPQFVEPILQGTKIHTIRNGNRWKVGDKIHFATGVRTKNYDCFKKGIVKSIQNIEIIESKIYINDTIVKIDNKQLKLEETQQLAWHDGFYNLIVFWWFFKDKLPFKGQLIHWTDFKY